MQVGVRDKSVKRTYLTATNPVNNKSQCLTVYGYSTTEIMRRIRLIAGLQEGEWRRLIESAPSLAEPQSAEPSAA